MTWRLVVMKRVLQAGHWKSLKTSMTMGAFLEPKASRGSTSGTGADDWLAPTPSADPSSSTKKLVRHKIGELALRKRSTQSSSIIYRTEPEGILYNPMPNENITCDSVRNEALPPSMCPTDASGCYIGCVSEAEAFAWPRRVARRGLRTASSETSRRRRPQGSLRHLRGKI